jgi:hypothetical protein
LTELDAPRFETIETDSIKDRTAIETILNRDLLIEVPSVVGCSPDHSGRRSPLKDEEVDTLEDYSRRNPDAFRPT